MLPPDTLEIANLQFADKNDNEQRMLRFQIGDKPPLLQELAKGTVVAIGNFDGVHLGHQKIIQRAVEIARQRFLTSVVLMFDPHPSEVVGKGEGKELLSEVETRGELLRDSGVEHVVCLQFNRELSLLSADQFVSQILIDWLHCKYLSVGSDFRLGYRRSGGQLELEALGRKMGFDCAFLEPLTVDGIQVSSSAIRESLKRGDVKQAARLLSRPYALTGVVVHGSRRGGGLGIPTANLKVAEKILVPRVGVYCGWVRFGQARYRAVVNIGFRPTFDRPTENQLPTIEIHLLDFSESVYGESLTLEFVARLRDEVAFTDAGELRRRIDADIKEAREVLAKA